MSAKSETIRARVEPALKSDAEAILRKLGLSATSAISLFYRQVVMNKGLPFEVRIPNATTQKALENTRSRRLLKKTSAKELKKEMGIA